MTPLSIGSTIGIIGGGQLGRMLSNAAAKLGFDTSVYSPEANSPAARVTAQSTVGAYEDLEALRAWASDCD
ncbi:MAG: 5-(carboxyamino)imidazole ribonucleotide synthase, partial [Pseudomonadota bacterium]